jgi:methyl-accepting chemotaxis protein
VSRLKNLSIVQEVLLILSIPIVFLTLLLANNVYQHLDDTKEFARLSNLSELCEHLAELIDDLQAERYRSSLYAGGTTTLVELQNACDETDRLMTEITNRVEIFKKDYPQHRERVIDLFLPLQQNYNKIKSFRMSIQNKTITDQDAIIDTYGVLNDAAINNLTSFPRWISTGNIFRRMISIAHLSNSIGLTGQIRAEIAIVLQKGEMDNSCFENVKKFKAERSVHEDVFNDLCVPNVQKYYLEKIQEPLFLEATQVLDKIMAEGVGKKLSINLNTTEWRAKQTQKVQILKEVETFAVKELYQELARMKQEAQKGLILNIGILLIVLVAVTFSVLYSMKGIKTRFQMLEEGLNKISQGDLTQPINLEGNNELGRLAKFINEKVLGNLSNINVQLQKIAGTLKMVVQELSASSKEISTTANQQSAGVKEVVSTMEDTDQLSKQIAHKIGEVTQAVQKSEGEIQKGFGIIQQNQGKMGEIKDGNNQTIEGIKQLGQQINSIWDIVNMINGIADQTKIIAFNAELEASSAGEAGKNFQIVATEIRRLADNTVNSTSEIKAKIHEIQKSSDHLIVTAESGSSKIQEGWQLSQSLQDVFNVVLHGSEITVKSSDVVSQSVQQQVGAFEQIVLTMRQLAEGISSSSTAVGGTTKMAENLQNIASDLDKIVQQYKLPSETIRKKA